MVLARKVLGGPATTRGDLAPVSPHVDRLRALAAEGLHCAAAARIVGIGRAHAAQLAERHGITFALCLVMPREHYRRAGRASAKSPRHHHFTNEERRRAGETRRDRA